MTEIKYNKNNKKYFKIELKCDIDFGRRNTLNYIDYKSGGYIEEIILPKEIKYESFFNNLEKPISNDDNLNYKKNLVFYKILLL